MHNTTAPPVCADQQQQLLGKTFSFDPTANNGQLLEEVVAFYHQRIIEHQPAHEFLTRRGLSHDLIEHFELGFADRQLGLSIPMKRCQVGATLRKRLAKIGIYRETGHGHFNGSLTVPIRNREGEVCELYGRKIGAHLTKGTRFHSYLADNSRPHGSARGIFNWSSICEADEIIVTDSILNALTFY